MKHNYSIKDAEAMRKVEESNRRSRIIHTKLEVAGGNTVRKITPVARFLTNEYADEDNVTRFTGPNRDRMVSTASTGRLLKGHQTFNNFYHNDGFDPQILIQVITKQKPEQITPQKELAKSKSAQKVIRGLSKHHHQIRAQLSDSYKDKKNSTRNSSLLSSTSTLNGE